MDPSEVRARLVWFERVGVVLLLLAALVPRVRDFTSRWDRELEGFQGSFFTVCAINYERLGVGLLGGYPIVNIDLPPDPETTSYKYPNHPPTVPLLTWASLKLFGPEGWNESWQTGEPPPAGTETAARFPFLALHMLGLLALWWAVRQAGGATHAMLALAVAAALPVSVLYGTLINFENPCLPFVLVAYGFHARFLREGRRRDLLWCGAAFLAGSAVTFTPAFFVPPLLLQTWLHRGWRRAFLQGAVVTPAALLPALLHGLWLRIVLPGESSEAVFARAARMLRPLTSGDAPVSEWARRQWIRMDHFFSTPLLLAACAGAVLVLWNYWSRWRRGRGAVLPEAKDEPFSLGLPLAAGGGLLLLSFYRHTYDGDGAENGQTVFLLNLAPACAVLAATFLASLVRPLAQLRGGFAPLVLVTSLFVLPALVRANGIRHRWRDPGPADDPALTTGNAQPLPHTAGREVAEILPAGTIGIYPHGLSFTPATAYYAWRTILPATEDTYDRAIAVVESMHGLGDSPRYILLPVHPREDMRAEVESIRARVAESFAMVDATDEWELWPGF